MPKTKKVSTKKETKKVVKKPFTLEVKVNDKEFKTEAKSIEEALTEFVNSPECPVGAKTICLVNFSKGKKKGKRIWQAPIARRIIRGISLKPQQLAVLAAKMEEELK